MMMGVGWGVALAANAPRIERPLSPMRKLPLDWEEGWVMLEVSMMSNLES